MMRRLTRTPVPGFIGLTFTILTVSTGATELASAYEPTSGREWRCG